MGNGKRVAGNFLLERGFLKKKGEKLFLKKFHKERERERERENNFWDFCA